MTIIFLRAFALLTQVHLFISRVQGIPVLTQDEHESAPSPSSHERGGEAVADGRFDCFALRLSHGGVSTTPPPTTLPHDGLTLSFFPTYEEEREIEKARLLDGQRKEARELVRSYQRTRRKNRTQEQVMLESAASRVRYQIRKESMTQAQTAKEKLRLSEKNKSYYQRILKPRKEALRLAREAEAGGSSNTSPALSPPSSSTNTPQRTSRGTGEASVFEDSIGLSRGIDGDESQGRFRLSKRGLMQNSEESPSKGEESSVQSEERKTKNKKGMMMMEDDAILLKEGSKRITEWRSVPDMHRTRKQKWYASLSPDAKDRYRAKSRVASQERRDAMTEKDKVLERKKKYYLEAKMKARWSEEEKKARGEIRRKKQKEYYHKVVKPRLAARKAAEVLQWLASEDLEPLRASQLKQLTIPYQEIPRAKALSTTKERRGPT